MNFIDICLQVFLNSYKKYESSKDLSKDLQNFDKALYYLRNFYNIDRKEIEKFIVDVRKDNPIYTLKQQLLRLTSGVHVTTIDNIDLSSLYNELAVEWANILYKGVHDSIKLFNDLKENESEKIYRRLIDNDMTIFYDYKFEGDIHG